MALRLKKEGKKLLFIQYPYIFKFKSDQVVADSAEKWY